MPTRKVKGGWQYGIQGKIYPTKKLADRQGRAIKVNQMKRKKR